MPLGRVGFVCHGQAWVKVSCTTEQGSTPLYNAHILSMPNFPAFGYVATAAPVVQGLVTAVTFHTTPVNKRKCS